MSGEEREIDEPDGPAKPSKERLPGDEGQPEKEKMPGDPAQPPEKKAT